MWVILSDYFVAACRCRSRFCRPSCNSTLDGACGLRGPLRVIIMVMLGVIVFNPPASSILICANTKVRTKRASPFGLHVPIDCVRRVIAWPLIACNNYLRVTIDLTQSIVRA
jgi:hypothetical protein